MGEIDKSEDFQELGKTLGITSELALGLWDKNSESRVLPRRCWFLPKLLFPWNPLGEAEEQPKMEVIRTMKKMIL